MPAARRCGERVWRIGVIRSRARTKRRRSSCEGKRLLKRIVILISAAAATWCVARRRPAAYRSRGGQQQSRGTRAGSRTLARHSGDRHRSPLYADRETFDAALREAIDAHSPDLVVLRGLHAHTHRALRASLRGPARQHPSSLRPCSPACTRIARARGRHAHPTAARSIRHADARSRAHRGAAAVPVHEDDDEDTLAARVLREEHRIYRRRCAGSAKTGSRSVRTGAVAVRGAPPAEGALVSPTLDARHGARIAPDMLRTTALILCMVTGAPPRSPRRRPSRPLMTCG